MDLSVGGRLSHYRILQKLGEGGMGVVYRAIDERLGRTVALKVLRLGLLGDERMRRRFLREGRAAAAITHPNVATVYDIDEIAGQGLIVMEFVEGETLRALLARGPTPVARALHLGIQVADALVQAHELGIVHRDLKPENIMVGKRDRVKVIDFGLAKLLPVPDEILHAVDAPTVTRSTPLSESGRIIGTVAYMSPEQALGRPADTRSDLFAFGTVLYEMVTGKHPFREATVVDTLYAVARRTAASAGSLNPQTPLAVGAILDRCLEKGPSQRYQKAEDLLVDLKGLARQVESGRSPSYDEVAGMERAARRKRRALYASLILLLTLGLAIGARVWGAGFGTRERARTILIMPLTVRGVEPARVHLGAEFAEVIAAKLARYGELRVLPVPHIGEDAPRDPLERARREGAGWVLAGTIATEGASVHAAVQLLDSIEKRVIWGETFKVLPNADPKGSAGDVVLGVAEHLGVSAQRAGPRPWAPRAASAFNP